MQVHVAFAGDSPPFVWNLKPIGFFPAAADSWLTF